MITVLLNNKLIECREECWLQSLLNTNYDKTGTYAVAINQHFIPKSAYDKTLLKQHDQIDIIRPMQGG